MSKRKSQDFKAIQRTLQKIKLFFNFCKCAKLFSFFSYEIENLLFLFLRKKN